MRYELETYEEADGGTPVEDWLDSLDPVSGPAAMRAISLILGALGQDVCNNEYGKSLGRGLYELRVRHDANEIIRAHAPGLLGKLKPPPPRGKVLVRVFFHPHGNKMILLLGGYDKQKDPSVKRQGKEIKVARKRLARWQEAQGITGQRSRSFFLWWRNQVRR